MSESPRQSNFLTPEWPSPANVGALSTTRRGGVSIAPYDDGAGGGGLNLGMHVGDEPEAVRRNRELLRVHLPAEPAWLTQVHGAAVLEAIMQENAPKADASFAVRPGSVCAVQTADCLPVLFCDVDGRCVAAAHAGWRGLAAGVLDNTVERMRAAGADEIMAWLGPAIGPRSFEVGQDVRDAFCGRDVGAIVAFEALAAAPGKYLADIYALARMTLQRIGVTQAYGGGRCTVKERGNFYSYRRDGITGRMVSLIWLK